MTLAGSPGALPANAEWLRTLLPKLPLSLQQKVLPFAIAVDRELAAGNVDRADDLAAAVLGQIEEEMAYGA